MVLRGDDPLLFRLAKRETDIDQRFGKGEPGLGIEDKGDLVVGNQLPAPVHPVHFPDAGHPERVHLSSP